MQAAADAIIVGRFETVTPGRVVVGDAPEDVVVHAEARVGVTDSITGDVGTAVSLEFLIPLPPDEAEQAIKAMEADVPRGDVVVFLREKTGDGEEGLFRTVNSRGLWAETARASLDTPLSDEPPQEVSLYADELSGIETVDQLVELLKSIEQSTGWRGGRQRLRLLEGAATGRRRGARPGTACRRAAEDRS